MRYYFAARYSRHAELAGYRDQLLASVPAAEVTSRWIDQHDGELEQSYTPERLNADPEACWKHGQHDLNDLDEAGAIVSFTGAGGGGKGGRHIEHGYAIAACEGIAARTGRTLAVRLIVVGPRENIFHCHPATEVFPDFAAFLLHEIEHHGERL